MSLLIYHSQFNKLLAQSNKAALYAENLTIISKKSAVTVLIREKNRLHYTDVNIIDIAKFDSVKYLDIICNIEAVSENRFNINSWNLYNFIYQYSDVGHVLNDSRFDLTQF